MLHILTLAPTLTLTLALSLALTLNCSGFITVKNVQQIYKLHKFIRNTPNVATRVPKQLDKKWDDRRGHPILDGCQTWKIADLYVKISQYGWVEHGFMKVLKGM